MHIGWPIATGRLFTCGSACEQELRVGHPAHALVLHLSFATHPAGGSAPGSPGTPAGAQNQGHGGGGDGLCFSLLNPTAQRGVVTPCFGLQPCLFASRWCTACTCFHPHPLPAGPFPVPSSACVQCGCGLCCGTSVAHLSQSSSQAGAEGNSCRAGSGLYMCKCLDAAGLQVRHVVQSRLHSAFYWLLLTKFTGCCRYMQPQLPWRACFQSAAPAEEWQQSSWQRGVARPH